MFASDIKNKFKEEFNMNNNVLAVAKENEFLQDMLEYLTDPFMNIFVKEGNKWCYQRPDPSGRDFYKSIPVYAMSESEWERVCDNIRDCVDDYEWDNIDEFDLDEFIYDDFPEIFEEWAENN